MVEKEKTFTIPDLCSFVFLSLESLVPSVKPQTVSPQWFLPQLDQLFIERVYATLCIASTLGWIWDTVCFHGDLHSQHLHKAYSLSTYFAWFILIRLTFIKSGEGNALYLSLWKYEAIFYFWLSGKFQEALRTLWC